MTSRAQRQFDLFEGSASPEAIQRIQDERIKLRSNVEALLRNVARQIRPCKGCGATIFIVQHKNGKPAPYTADGTNHFANCPKATEFEKL